MTESGHVNRALGFMDVESIFVGIGKQSQWEDEQNPSEPTGNESTIQEIIGYKKIFSKRLVKQDPEGDIRYKGQNWSVVSRENAFKEGAKWVMLEVFLEYDELPVNVQYRQVGIFTGLVPQVGYEKTEALLPAQVKNKGIMEVIDNRKVEYRDIDKKEGIVVIIQF